VYYVINYESLNNIKIINIIIYLARAYIINSIGPVKNSKFMLLIFINNLNAFFSIRMNTLVQSGTKVLYTGSHYL